MDASNDDELARSERLRDRLRRTWNHVRGANHKVVARAAIVSHLGYYSLVFIESHSWYGIAGGICGFILIVEIILGEHPHE